MEGKVQHLPEKAWSLLQSNERHKKGSTFQMMKITGLAESSSFHPKVNRKFKNMFNGLNIFLRPITKVLKNRERERENKAHQPHLFTTKWLRRKVEILHNTGWTSIPYTGVNIWHHIEAYKICY